MPTQNIYPNHQNRYKLIKEAKMNTITIPNHNQAVQSSIFPIVEVSFEINNSQSEINATVIVANQRVEFKNARKILKILVGKKCQNLHPSMSVFSIF